MRKYLLSSFAFVALTGVICFSPGAHAATNIVEAARSLLGRGSVAPIDIPGTLRQILGIEAEANGRVVDIGTALQSIVVLEIYVFETGSEVSTAGANTGEVQGNFNDFANQVCQEYPGLQSWARLQYSGAAGGTGYEFINCN